MKVLFLESIEGSASMGEVKDVANGYARNYLLPNGLAVPATEKNFNIQLNKYEIDIRCGQYNALHYYSV